MSHVIDINATAVGLNTFVQKNSEKINSKLRQNLEFEAVLPFVEAESHYVGHDVTIGNILQPYQPDFTPNNTEAHDGITAVIQPIKVDAQFTAEQLGKFMNKWKSNYFDPDPKKIKMKYADYMLAKHFLPKLMEEVNLVSWKGEYVAPVKGTPGAVLESCDGFAKKFVDHITDGLLTPIVTGALVANTMLDQVEAFCAGIPEPYRFKNGLLFMSKTNAKHYSNAYKNKYLNNSAVINTADGIRYNVDDYNKVIIGISAMEGSNRIICQFDSEDGMQVGTRKGFPKYFKLRFQEFDRTLKVMSEAYRFYDLETPLHTFVNEQV